MSNQLGVAVRNSIIRLKKRGYSHREIARMLGICRGTVNKHVKDHHASEKPPNPPLGSDAENQPNPPTGFSGPPSLCRVHHSTILEWAEKGLSAKRIHQDLVSERNFTGSYDSVKRYMRKFSVKAAVPFRRMETPPGKEAQVDFGQGAPVMVDGRKKRPHVLCVTLSNSRESYQEVVWRQTTENYIRALENAFRHFGGVPETLVIDNLRAAVKKADWFDPELNPKIIDFSKHYHTVILPTRPYTPEHKGKVESQVKYVQENALKGRIFNLLAEQNEYLRDWNAKVAGTRVHGTTKEQVRKTFDKEKPHLQALPFDLFPCFEEGARKVHRDGYIEVGRSYYSVPDEYCRREVWARWDGRTVRIFNLRQRQIAFHAKVAPGKYSTNKRHIPERKISGAERGPEWILDQVREIGPAAEAWTRAMLKNRGLQGVRPSLGLLALRKKHATQSIDDACGKALTVEAFKLKDVRGMLTAELVQPEFTFMEKHPLIRNIDEYEAHATWKGESSPIPLKESIFQELPDGS